MIALLTSARPGMRAADFCAGGGGKILALAVSMAIGEKIEGSLWDCDTSAFRLECLAPRLQRAGAETVNSKVVAARNDPWMTDNASEFDRVLTDVPSTSTQWRDPDARWRFTPANLNDILAVQQQILEMAQTLVKLRGRLVYTSHSLLQEKNERQLAWFLENHADFQALPIDGVWAETIGGPPPPEGLALRLSPASTGTDGFYCAVMERK